MRLQDASDRPSIVQCHSLYHLAAHSLRALEMLIKCREPHFHLLAWRLRGASNLERQDELLQTKIAKDQTPETPTVNLQRFRRAAQMLQDSLIPWKAA